MKRTLAWILVIAMLACMIPVFSIATFAADEEDNSGLNAKLYQLIAKEDVLPYSHDRYYDIVGTTTGRDPWCSFDDTVRFGNALPTLLYTSKEDTSKAETGLTGLTGIFGADGYLIKWEGTITADATGEYTLVGRKIDNGFLAFVDQNGDGEFSADEKFYDYASPNHWFDGDEDRLISQQGAFKLEADEATAVQFWYYEADGGEACTINVSTEGGANDKSFGDAGLSLLLNKTVYTSKLVVNHDRINGIETLPAGITADGNVATDNNGCQADNEGNHNYAKSINDIMAQMFYLGEVVLPTFESSGFAGLGYTGFEYEDSVIDYTGYITPATSGIYQFGTTKVDNCLFIEIQIDGEWVTAYEFWAKYVWNDSGTTYYNYNEDLKLEAGTSYPIHVTFLEINGGEAIESVVKINGTENSFATSGLKLTTEPAKVAPVTTNFFNMGGEWKYMTSGAANDQAPAENWITDSSVWENWSTGNIAGGWGSDDAGSVHKNVWVAREFTVADLDAVADLALAMNINYDDNMSIYINGKLVYQELYWSAGSEIWKIANKASDVLVEGKNTIAISLIQGHGGHGFDMGLYATNTLADTDLPTYIVNTDEFLAFVDAVNANPDKSADLAVVLGADLDFAGINWTPMNLFKGQIYGNGHTIKNITYATTGTNAATDVLGMFVRTLSHTGNDKNTAVIDGIVFENCSYTTAGITVGLVVGGTDRALVRNVTVKNCTITNEGANAAVFAGDIRWGCAFGNLMNCTAENTVVTATGTASGLAVFTEVGEGETAELDGNTLINVTLNAPKAYADVSNKNGTNNITDLVVKSELSSADKDYTFYYQTRTNAEDATKVDYRIICVANTEWATAQTEIKVKMSFTNGTETKTATQAADTVYNTVTATGNGYTDVYGAADGSVIFGWVIEGVPADYAATAPTAEVVD